MKIFGSSRTFPHEGAASATENSITTKAHDLFQKTQREKPLASAMPSCKRVDGHWRIVRAQLPERPITDIGQRTQALCELVEGTARFQTECTAFKKECQDRFNELSIFKPSTWKALFRELVDKVIIFFFGPLFSFGKYVSAKARVEELEEHVQDKVQFFESREYLDLSKYATDRVKKRQSVEAYALLEALNPQDTRPSLEIGQTLVEEGAYKLGTEALDAYLKKDPHNTGAKMAYITALKGQREFEKAKKEIESFQPIASNDDKEKLKLIKAECLAGLEKFDDTKVTFFSIENKTDAIIRKILYLQVREALQDGAKNEALAVCTRTFNLLDGQKNAVLQGNGSKNEFMLLLDTLFTQKDMKQQSSDRIIGMFIDTAKELASDIALELIDDELKVLEQEVDTLKQELPKQSMPICDAIENALNEVQMRRREHQRSGSDYPFETRGVMHKKQVLSKILTELNTTKKFTSDKLLQLQLRVGSLNDTPFDTVLQSNK